MSWTGSVLLLALLAGIVLAGPADPATSNSPTSDPPSTGAKSSGDKIPESKTSASLEDNAPKTHGLPHRPNFFGAGYPVQQYEPSYGFAGYPYSLPWGAASYYPYSLSLGAASSHPYTLPLGAASSYSYASPSGGASSLLNSYPATGSIVSAPSLDTVSAPVAPVSPIVPAPVSTPLLPIASAHAPVVSAPSTVAISGTTVSKPVVSYQPQLVHKPSYPVSEQIIHRPVVFQLRQLVQQPVYAVVSKVIHKPYLAEIVEKIQQPTYQAHYVLKPSVSSYLQETVAPPLQLALGEQHVLEKPTSYVYQLPTKYGQPWTSEVLHVPVHHQVPVTHTNVLQTVTPPVSQQLPSYVQTPALPQLPAIAPAPFQYTDVSTSHLPFGGYGGYGGYGSYGSYGGSSNLAGNGGEISSSWIVPAPAPTCRDGNCRPQNKGERDAESGQQDFVDPLWQQTMFGGGYGTVQPRYPTDPSSNLESDQKATPAPADESATPAPAYGSTDETDKLVRQLLENEDLKKKMMEAMTSARNVIEENEKKEAQKLYDQMKQLSPKAQKHLNLLKENQKTPSPDAVKSQVDDAPTAKTDKVEEKVEPAKAA